MVPHSQQLIPTPILIFISNYPSHLSRIRFNSGGTKRNDNTVLYIRTRNIIGTVVVRLRIYDFQTRTLMGVFRSDVRILFLFK